jgi:hypothetical protein
MRNCTQQMRVVSTIVCMVLYSQMAFAHDAPKVRPIQATTGVINMTNVAVTQNTMFKVPKGRRLTIEYFSCEGDLPVGQFFSVHLTTIGGSVQAGFDLTPVKLGTVPTPQDIMVYSQIVKIYADSETDVLLTLVRSLGVGGALVRCSFAGELAHID